MTKFHCGEKVRIKDNPTKMRGVPMNHPGLTPGTVVEVEKCTPDSHGDIIITLPNASGSDDVWDYVSEDSIALVETDPHDVRVGDRIRAYNKLTEITIEGVVRGIEPRGDHKWLWIGKGYDIAADLNTPECYGIYVLERAFKWPDHEGFIRVTGGKYKGERGLAFTNLAGTITVRTASTSVFQTSDLGFNFEYVEG